MPEKRAAQYSEGYRSFQDAAIGFKLCNRTKAVKTCVRLAAAAMVCGPMLAGAPGIGHAQQNDYANGIAEQYDRVRTESEIAETIRAGTQALGKPPLPSEQRARACYFRGLNHFLDAVRLGNCRDEAGWTGSDAVQNRLKLALQDLAACIGAAPEPSAFPFSLRATICTVLAQYDNAVVDLEQAIHANPAVSSQYVQRALILERLNRFSEARADLDNAVTLDREIRTHGSTGPDCGRVAFGTSGAQDPQTDQVS